MAASKFIGFFLLSFLIYSIDAKLSAKQQSEDAENSAEAEKYITFTPRGIKSDGYTYLARAKRKFRVECQFNSDDLHSFHDLKWTTKNGIVIDGYSSTSRFTVAMRKKNSHHIKKSLVFTHIEKRDEGVYTCEAQLQGRTVQRQIRIHVAEPIEWSMPKSKVNAQIGEDLVVDCDATANPEPSIYIMDDQGRDMTEKYGQKIDDDSNEDDDEHKITIQGITKLDHGRKIICSANQFFEDLQATDSEDHEITVDVWYPPEFEEPEISQYAIEGRPVHLLCNVSDANPAPTIYRFFQANKELRDDRDYEIKIDENSMSASLLIKNVQDNDFGSYRCEVGNMVKARSNLLISLKEAQPPHPVHSDVIEQKKHAIILRITQGKKEDENELPVIRYIVQYQRAEEDNYPRRYEIAAKPNENSIVYEVPGLIQGMDYSFQFMAESAAGISESFNLTASTLDES
uniref:Uncharacterized protein n=1 Tax=Acrobeloides nanus TaxID=290746 RepID=A0A914C5M6_9BILA